MKRAEAAPGMTDAEAHGRLGAEVGRGLWVHPKLKTFCAAVARPGYSDVAAHEYEDDDETMDKKVTFLASLMQRSRRTVVYTGAGISTGSGIADYATRSSDAVGSSSSSSSELLPVSPVLAQPTSSHRLLVAMYRSSLVHEWIQQNHDGLAHKAGMPAQAVNEIHGSLYDPSNPVVSMSGALRQDLFQRLLRAEGAVVSGPEAADLVLALGSSLSGMNSDRVVVGCEARARNGGALGSCIITLQRTQLDGSGCGLRIFGRLDHVLGKLASKLGLHAAQQEALPISLASSLALPTSPEAAAAHPCALHEDMFSVPYDRDGVLQSCACSALDLREGARVRITDGHFKGDEGLVVGKNREGHYRLVVNHTEKKLKVAWPMLLGAWFVCAALQGSIPVLPVVNVQR
jgi:hypothetical protein